MKDKKSVRKLYSSIEEEFSQEFISLESYKEVAKRRNKKEDVLKNCVSEEDFELIQEFIEIKNEITSLEVEEAFIKGFSMAYQLLIDSVR